MIFVSRAGTENPFGCSNYQNSTLVRHLESKGHVNAIKTLKLRSDIAVTKARSQEKSTELINEKNEQIVKHIIRVLF